MSTDGRHARRARSRDAVIDAAVDGEASRPDRVATLVRARIALYTAAGPLMHIARQRALDYQPMADGVGRMRARLADQTRECFAPEVRTCTPADAANLVATIDAATSPEAFEVMGAAHGRSARQMLPGRSNCRCSCG